MLARVVSKWLLLGMTLPGPPISSNRMRSLARPWCVGRMCGMPVSSRSTASKRYQLRAPAYDSSPRIMPAHCSLDIAAVPLSVSRSIITSSAGIWKTLKCARRRIASRSAGVVSLIGSTILILNGSMMVFTWDLRPAPGASVCGAGMADRAD